MFATLKNLFRRKKSRPRMLRLRLLRPPLESMRVTVYSRARCQCCETAMATLEDYRRRYGFTIESIDIDQDPSLRQSYDSQVPVVAIDGKVRFRGKLNTVLLDRILFAKLADQSRPAASHST
jgi:glutaredoxin